MTYQVTAPLVIIPNDDKVSGDWYGYRDAIVPDGLNDERCKQLAKEGMLTTVKASKPSAPSVEDILAAVGDDKAKAAEALEAEKSGKARKTLLDGLQAVIDKGA